MNRSTSTFFATSGSYVPYVDGQTSSQIAFASCSSDPLAIIEQLKPTQYYPADGIPSEDIIDKPLVLTPNLGKMSSDSY